MLPAAEHLTTPSVPRQENFFFLHSGGAFEIAYLFKLRAHFGQFCNFKKVSNEPSR